MKRTSGHVRPRPAKRRKAGKDRLRFVQLDGHDLAAVASVPTQSRPLEQIGAAKQQAQSE